MIWFIGCCLLVIWVLLKKLYPIIIEALMWDDDFPETGPWFGSDYFER